MTLSTSDAGIAHFHSSADSRAFYLSFVSVATLDLSLPEGFGSLLLRITPEISTTDAYVWNAWMQIEDQTTGEKLVFFSGSPIDAYDANFLAAPPLEETVVSLATGRSYWISSRFKTTAREPRLDHTGFLSLAFAHVPEPSACLLVLLGLVAVAWRSRRT